MTTQLKQAKNQLKQIAEYAKGIFSTDKPAIRQTINDSADAIGRDLKLNEKQIDSLANYACKLHP